MGVCPICGKATGSGSSGFNHVSEPASHSTSSSGSFVTDKPTSDPNYAGHRFMSSNVSGTKKTQIYNDHGHVVKTK